MKWNDEFARALQRNLTHEVQRLESMRTKLEASRVALRTFDGSALTASMERLVPLLRRGEALERERRDLLAKLSESLPENWMNLVERQGTPDLRRVAREVRERARVVADRVRGMFLLGRFQRQALAGVLSTVRGGGSREEGSGALLDREA